MSDDEKDAKKELEKTLQAKIDTENASLTGVGTRRFFGFTRGRSTMPIFYSAFDLSKPETLPTTVKQFTEVTQTKDEKTLLEYVLTGYNDEQYTAASDPIAEYVNNSWSDDKKLQFRLVVRNLSKMLEISIEEAATATLSKMK